MSFHMVLHKAPLILDLTPLPDSQLDSYRLVLTPTYSDLYLLDLTLTFYCSTL